MEKRKEGTAAGVLAERASCGLPLFCFLFSIFFFCSCGAPGEPTPPRPAVPATVTDVAAQQSGDRVVLTFTLPRETLEGKPLRETPQVDIYRGYAPPGSPEPLMVPGSPAYTLSPAVVDTHLSDGVVRFEDPVKAEALAEHGHQQWVYAVRTQVSKRRKSEISNIVALRVYAPPPRVTGLTAEVTESAVELRWEPAAAPAASYRVYRTEAGAEAQTAAQPVPLGTASTPSYRDPEFEFGRTYRYTVRSVAQYETDSVESADSPPVEVTPRDTFPPAAPAELVAVPVPPIADAPAVIELSWGISAEADLAGYHVYRSEQETAEGGRQTRELLLSPTFRDISVVAGRRYFYRVTAVDRAGNESARSSPVSETVLERP